MVSRLADFVSRTEPQLLTVSRDSGTNNVIIAPVPSTKNEPKQQCKQINSNKADDTTPPASGQHPNWVPNATTGRAMSIAASPVLCLLHLTTLLCMPTSSPPYSQGSRVPKSKQQRPSKSSTSTGHVIIMKNRNVGSGWISDSRKMEVCTNTPTSV